MICRISNATPWLESEIYRGQYSISIEKALERLPDRDKHVFLGRQVFNRIVSRRQGGPLNARLQDVCSQQSRPHWSQRLVKHPVQAISGLGIVEVLNQLERHDSRQVDSHGPLGWFVADAQGV